MPKLQIDQFDETPHVGDKVKVTGKVKHIDEDNGEVEVSYDDVKIINDKKKSKNDSQDTYTSQDNMPTDMSNSDSLDNALSQAFPTTQ